MLLLLNCDVMLIKVKENLKSCLYQAKSPINGFIKIPRNSLIKLWLMLIALAFTLIILLNIRLDISKLSPHRKIYHSQSLAKVLINRLSAQLNRAVKPENNLIKKKVINGQSREELYSNQNSPLDDDDDDDDGVGGDDDDDDEDDDYYGIKDGQFIWKGKYRPWFLINGTIRPDPMNQMFSELNVWPDDFNTTSTDRIVNQLMYIPFGYDPETIKKANLMKKINLAFEPDQWDATELPMGQQVFIHNQCPVNTCQLIHDSSSNGDAVLFKDFHPRWYQKKSSNQIWIYYMLESPLNTPYFRKLNNKVNWTATFRHDSELVTPYEKFVPYLSNSQRTNLIDHAFNKSKKVAWFVSNCASHNNRLEYAKELSKHIQVDIFGRCGRKECARKDADKCFQMLSKEYKFYLAFENSDCRDYITEKFFINGLSNNILPIVKGASESDYRRSSPHHSYIHVDNFKSAKELADYLHILDSNNTLYNQYFQWKNTGQLINTRFWCRLCALLHAPKKTRHYSNLNNWWHSTTMCKSSTM